MPDVAVYGVGAAPRAARCVAFARPMRRKQCDHLSGAGARPFAGGWCAAVLIGSMATACASDLRNHLPPSHLGESSRPMAL